MAGNKLGRGLDALFGDFALDDELTPLDAPTPKQKTSAPADGVQELDINLIDNNLEQPRKQFDPVALQELADSIRTYGVIQPILVTPVGNRYLIVAGERRWRATKMAGLAKIPAVVKMFNVKQIAEIAIIENLQRDDLNEMELARGVQKLMDEHHLTQEKVAERLAKPRSTVANWLRLLGLPERVQDLVAEKKLTAGHAIRLLSLSDAGQITALAERAVAENLSVRALGELVDGKLFVAGKTTKPRKDPLIREQEKLLATALGTRAEIKGNQNRGKIILHYHASEELTRLVELLKHTEK